MPYPVQAVANFFLDLAEQAGRSLDPMQIQKLVYFGHGWYLALTGKPLVDEHPEAWPYGPVFPTLYHGVKQYGAGPIQGRVEDWKIDGGPANARQMVIRSVAPSLDDDPDVDRREYAKQVLRRVWNVYGSWSALQLSQLTHVAGGPWDQTRNENPNRKGSDISDDVIRDYFLRKAGQPA